MATAAAAAIRIHARAQVCSQCGYISTCYTDTASTPPPHSLFTYKLLCFMKNIESNDRLLFTFTTIHNNLHIVSTMYFSIVGRSVQCAYQYEWWPLAKNPMPCRVSATTLMKPSGVGIGESSIFIFLPQFTPMQLIGCRKLNLTSIPIVCCSKEKKAVALKALCVLLLKSISSQAFSISFIFRKSSIRTAFQVFWFYRQAATI